MAYLSALLIFAVTSACCWFVSIAVFKSTVGSPDPVAHPQYWRVTAAAIGAATLALFVPYPNGYFVGLFVWLSAVFGYLDLSFVRGCILCAYLALASFLQRLIFSGFLNFADKNF